MGKPNSNGKDRKEVSLTFASEYVLATHGLKRTASAVRSAIKNGRISADALREQAIPGTNYPPVIWIDQEALDVWATSSAKKPTVGRAARSRGRKYVVFLQDDQVAAVRAALEPLSVDLTLAFTKKATAPISTDNGAENLPESVELELVEG